MIPGISYWSFEHGLENTHPIDDALVTASACGFQAFELAIGVNGVLHVGSTQNDCLAIRKSIDKLDIHVSSVASGLTWEENPVSNVPSVREASLEKIIAALRRTAWLGCEALLYVPGVVGSPIVPSEHVRYDVAVERCRENLQRLLPIAESLEVDLCLENVWNGLFLSPVELSDFIDSFGSPRLGVYFDVGNCLGYHQHPPHWIEFLGERIRRVHVKDFKHTFGWKGEYSFVQIGEGDVPWPETLAALRGIQYSKTIIAEMLPASPSLVESTAQALRSILQ